MTKALTFKKLSETEWLQIANLVEQGEPVQKVAKIYGVHYSVVYRTLKKRGVRIGASTRDAAEEAARQDREKLVQRIKETKEQDYRYTSALQQMVVTTIVDARKEGRSPASVQDDVKTLKIALDAVAKGTDNKWRILGLDNENANADQELPELPIREMTDIEVEAIRNRQEMEDSIFELETEDSDELEIETEEPEATEEVLF